MESEPEQTFRLAMGAFATGVTVVSAARDGGRISGITVNSLTSVSLKPQLLLWCLGDQSERYDAFAEADRWGVTVLAAAEEALAHRFSRAEAETIEAEEAEYFGGVPVLRAGVAHLACRTRDRRVVGDHLVIVGEAANCRVRPGAALSFFRGRYGRIDDRSQDSGSK
jgi:flavin reductase (DIM6/NTAB) family NADH-FMN oxidoreductase RutF